MEPNVTRSLTCDVHESIVTDPESEENLEPRKRQTAIPSTSRVSSLKTVEPEPRKSEVPHVLRDTTAPPPKVRFQPHEPAFRRATKRCPIEQITSPPSAVQRTTIYQFLDPKLFAPSLVQHSTGSASQTTFKPQRQLVKATPDLDERIIGTSAVPHGTDRRRSNAAPRIVAPPPETIKKDMELFDKPTAPKKRPKKLANYPPEEQYPPAPAYPLRDTPSWTRPDTHTPPPKCKTDSPPVKHTWFGWCKLPPVQRAPPKSEANIHRDEHPVEPFRHPLPRVTLGRPGETLRKQEPSGYSKTPARKSCYPCKTACYALLVPILNSCKPDHPRSQLPLLWNNISSSTASSRRNSLQPTQRDLQVYHLTPVQ
jgi:hypothetical protein